MDNPGLISVINSFDAALNSHDPKAVMAFFTEDAVVRLFPPLSPGDAGAYRGKAQIREFVWEYMSQNPQIASGNHHVEGNRVTWESDVYADLFRDVGADPAHVLNEAVLEGGRISYLSLTFAPELVAKVGAATGVPRNPRAR